MIKRLSFCFMAINMCLWAMPYQPIYQLSSLGVMDSSTAVNGVQTKEITSQGNFGVGIFVRGSGEMILDGGKMYIIQSNAKPYLTKPQDRIAFALVTPFNPTKQYNLYAQRNFRALSYEIEKGLPNTLIPYAIRIEGKFSRVNVRTFEPINKGKASLRDLVAKQKEYQFKNISGTAVGFWFPSYWGGDLAGLKLHFISEHKDVGGHVQDIAIDSCIVSQEDKPEIQIVFP